MEARHLEGFRVGRSGAKEPSFLRAMCLSWVLVLLATYFFVWYSLGEYVAFIAHINSLSTIWGREKNCIYLTLPKPFFRMKITDYLNLVEVIVKLVECLLQMKIY